MKSRKLLGGLALGLALALTQTAVQAGATFDPKAQPFSVLPPVALTGFNVSTGTQRLFSPWFDPVQWIGDLTALPVSTAGKTDLSSKLWSAATQLNAQNFDTGRRIVTFDPVAGVAVPFRWTSGIGAAQKTAIGTEMILNFIRGERSNEKELFISDGAGGNVLVNAGSSPAGTLRGRYSVLGDMLHGKAAYVGAPPADYVFDSYQTFKTNNLGRAGRVFAGANDGMLHAFDASTGDEVYAYVPHTLMSKLNLLSVSPYDHNYYVDGSLTVGDANFGTTAVPNWKTVLVGGLGAGGKGYYALDVTDPAAADETAAKAKVLWEINNATANFGDLGYTYGDVSIGRVNCTPVFPASTCTRWVAIVANGYLSANGKAVLYVVDLTNGTRIKAFDTGTGSAAAPNGLSTPTAIDTSLDGVIDYVYAGDMDGNVWKFNLKDADPNNWSIAQLHAAEDSNAAVAGVQGRPIIGPIDVAPHPITGYLVYFSTGRLFTLDEASDTTTQNYAYALWDGANNGGSTFLTQSLSTGTYGGAEAVRLATGDEPNWTAENRCDDDPPPATPAGCVNVAPPHKGWKIALPVGEHVITGGFVRDGRYHVVAVNTSQQNSPKPNGANWLMEFNYLTGGAPSTMVFDLSSDGLLTDSDRATDASGSHISGPEGVPLGIYLGPGMFSTPSLVLISSTLSTTLYNNNPYVSPGNGPDTPIVEDQGGRGVAGGHFDVDIYYANPTRTDRNGDSQTKICDYTPVVNIAEIRAKYSLTVATTGHTYSAKIGEIRLGGTPIADPLTVSNGTSTTTNATAIKDAINAKGSGYTATSSTNTVTITAPAGSGAGGNGLAFSMDAGAVAPPSGGTPATGKIVLAAQPSGGATRITGVTFNSTNLLPGTVGFSAGTSVASMASALMAAMSTPSGFTMSIATTNVANDTVLFTQTANGGAAPTISVAASNGNINDVRPTGLIRFGGGTSGNATISRSLLGSTHSIVVGTTGARAATQTIGNGRSPSQAAARVVLDVGTGGSIKAYIGGTAITPTCAVQTTSTVCLVDTTTYTNARAVILGTLNNFSTLTATLVATTGGTAPVAAVAQPTTTSATAGVADSGGSDNLVSFITTGQTVTGVNAGSTGGELTRCFTRKHVHEYDDLYDVTGVNMLAASESAYNLINAIPDAATQFKIISSNQYLSPAVTIEIGNLGPVSVKDFGTSATLNAGADGDPVDLPIYTRGDIGKFQFNMPRDAFKVKDWWGNGDDRVGLHPTTAGCIMNSIGADDGMMYQPVIPPANGVEGPGVNATNEGARHNGAVTWTLIKANTPNSALEMNVDGRPEYGWRVKRAEFENYVLVEYLTFWHHPNETCWGEAGWTKRPPEDTSSCLTDSLIAGMTIADAEASCYRTPAAGSSDPGLGTVRASAVSSTITSTVTGTGLDSVKTTVTVITYSDGSTMTVTLTQTARRLNLDGSVRSWNSGTQTTTYTGAVGGPGGGGAGSGAGGSATNQGSTVANTITGYQQSRNAGKLGRVSWRELIRQ